MAAAPWPRLARDPLAAARPCGRAMAAAPSPLLAGLASLAARDPHPLAPGLRASRRDPVNLPAARRRC